MNYIEIKELPVSRKVGKALTFSWPRFVQYTLISNHENLAWFQISFTIKELREMTKLPGCRAVFEPDDFQPIQEIISGKFSFIWFD